MQKIKLHLFFCSWVGILSIFFSVTKAQLVTSPQEALRIANLVKRNKDSLIHLIRTRPDDTVKVLHYLQLSANLLGESKHDSAAAVAGSGYKIALRLNHPRSVVAAVFSNVFQVHQKTRFERIRPCFIPFECQ